MADPQKTPMDCERCEAIAKRLRHLTKQIVKKTRQNGPQWQACLEAQLLGFYAEIVAGNYIQSETFDDHKATAREIGENIHTAMMNWLATLPIDPINGGRIHKANKS